MTFSIIDVKKTREGSALDEYQATYSLDNRLSIPVELSVISSIGVKAIRDDGAQLDTGYTSIPNTYSVPPGSTVFTSDPRDYLTIYHGFRVQSFFTQGTVSVRNSSEDQNARHMFCTFRDVVMGAPLMGYWG